MREEEAEELARVSARAPSRALIAGRARAPKRARAFASSNWPLTDLPRARARAMLLWAAARRDAGG